MCGCRRLDRLRNEVITHIKDKIRETRLRLFDYVMKRSVEALVRRFKMIYLPDREIGRRLLTKSCDEVIRHGLKFLRLT